MERNFPMEAAPAESLLDLPFPSNDDESYALAVGGVLMPRDGIGYIVALSPDRKRMRILGYEDTYCRVFATDRTEKIPPARFPSIQAFTGNESEDASEGELCLFSADGKPSSVARVRQRLNEMQRPEMSASALLKPPAKGSEELFRPHRAFAFMAIAFLAFCAPLRSAAIFSMQAVEKRLQGKGFMEGLSREARHVDLDDGDAPVCGAERHLAHMLREEGLVGAPPSELRVWPAGDPVLANEGEPPLDGPSAELIRTARTTNLFYIRYCYLLHGDMADNGGMVFYAPADRARAKILATEAALNRFALLVRSIDRDPDADFGMTQAECAQRDLQLFEHAGADAPDPRSPAGAEGIWEAHLNFARSIELLALPFRVIYDFQLNASATSLIVQLRVPSESMMPKSRWDVETRGYAATAPEERRRMQAEYAARLVLATAACAFHASSSVASASFDVQVDEGRRTTVMNGTVVRQAFMRQWAFYAQAGYPRPLATLQNLGVRFQIDEEGRLSEVARTERIGKGAFAPWAPRDPQECALPFSAHTCKFFKADSAKEAPIRENFEREKAGRHVAHALGASTSEAMRALKRVHDRTEDLALRSQCMQAKRKIESGAATPANARSIEAAFADPYRIRQKMAEAESLFRARDHRAVGALQDVINTIRAQRRFQDSSFTVYRYFPSYAERVVYTLKTGDDAHGASLRPLPEELFRAHELLALAYLESGDVERAGADARVCRKMSPATSRAHLLEARVYHARNDWGAVLNACSAALSVCIDADSFGTGLYCAAYAYWQLERYELAAAAYELAGACRSSARPLAQSELAELKQQVRGIPMHTPAQSTSLLESQGVPVRAFEQNVRVLFDAARSAANDGAIALGASLGTVANDAFRRDEMSSALIALEHSLAKQS